MDPHSLLPLAWEGRGPTVVDAGAAALGRACRESQSGGCIQPSSVIM
jgi:hypothetical protein